MVETENSVNNKDFEYETHFKVFFIMLINKNDYFFYKKF